MKNKFFESSAKHLNKQYQLDVYEDVLLGRDDRVILYADITNDQKIELNVITGTLTIFGYPEIPSITLTQLLDQIDYTCKYAEISGKKEYHDYIHGQLADFHHVIDVTFPVLVTNKRAWMKFTSFPVKKNQSVVVVYLNDLTEEMGEVELNYEKTHKDSLTQLLNKYSLDYHYGLRYKNKDFHVFYLDIDDFKDVNDADGHSIGDLYLQAFAAILKEYETEHDRFYRVGGDEFVGMLFKPENEIKQIAKQILDKTRQIKVHGSKKPITVSLGIVKATLRDDVIKKADVVMYKIKNSGKNAYIYTLET